ncbi:unnamed protein product [Camellia sinensis]
MGVVDTKSIESVQASLSLFGERSDQRKNQFTSCDELEREKELEDLLKDLANYKVQLEAKDSAYKQALLKLNHYQKTADELSILVKSSEFEKEIYINECREGRIRVHELESEMADMSDQLSKSEKMREQLSHFMSELKTSREELLIMETDLAAAIDVKLEALTQVEFMETELQMEKERTDELLRHVSELNEAIMHSKMASNEGDKEIRAVLAKEETELALATTTAVEAEEKLEYMRKLLEIMRDLENQLMNKSVFIDLLQLELNQANELRGSSEKAASDAISELNQVKSEFKIQERKSSDQLGKIEFLEMELNQLRLELKNEKEEVERLDSEAKKMEGELEKARNEMEEIGGREKEAQVEIAMLKSEVHKGRSRIAAAEAAEVMIKIEKSGLYQAVQQLALEADEAKKENRRLKEESENSVVDEDGRDETDACIKISKDEYEGLIEKAEKVAEHVPKNEYELENLKKELEIARVKIGEFRNRAEQASSRAEAAEKVKMALEDQMKNWREQRQRRKIALAALREESFPKESSSSFSYEQPPKNYQPLGTVLNMKF